VTAIEARRLEALVAEYVKRNTCQRRHVVARCQKVLEGAYTPEEMIVAQLTLAAMAAAA
jgi:hypothetical protein